MYCESFVKGKTTKYAVDKIAVPKRCAFFTGRVDVPAFNQILADQRKYLAIVLLRDAMPKLTLDTFNLIEWPRDTELKPH